MTLSQSVNLHFDFLKTVLVVSIHCVLVANRNESGLAVT